MRTSEGLEALLTEAGRRRGSSDLAEANILLAAKVARWYALDEDDFEELFSVCLERLVEEARKWQARKDHKVAFSTYVVHAMRQAIIRHRNTSHPVLPHTLVPVVHRYRRERDKFFAREGRWPRPEELAPVLGTTPKEARRLAHLADYAWSITSLDEPLTSPSGGTDDAALVDTLSDDPTAEQDSIHERDAVARAVEAARLTHLQRLSLALFYGARLVERATLRDVARASTYPAVQWARRELKRRGGAALEAACS